MMPRLVKLISDRKAKAKSYSASPVGQAWKRKVATTVKDDHSSGAGGASSCTAEETTRLVQPYEQLEGAQNMTSGSSSGISRREDIESAMADLDVQNFSDLLEQRLNIEFTVPKFSYP